MLHGPLTKKLIQFAIPVALTSMLQQLFHAADTSVVGHFADANALAESEQTVNSSPFWSRCPPGSRQAPM